MAVLTTKGLSGQIGKQLVFKASGGKTVVSAYAEPGKKKATELQQQFRDCFKRAQKRASLDSRMREVIERFTPYLKVGQSVYHFLMGLYHREEIKIMKKGEIEYKRIELLLSRETKKGKEVRMNENPKPTNNISNVWTYPNKKLTTPKVDYIPKMEVFISRPL